jgi:hypothetical protein
MGLPFLYPGTAITAGLSRMLHDLLAFRSALAISDKRYHTESDYIFLLPSVLYVRKHRKEFR